MFYKGETLCCLIGLNSTNSQIDSVIKVHLLDVPGQPHSGEVAPAQLTDHMVSSIEKIPNLHMVISTCPRKDGITHA